MSDNATLRKAFEGLDSLINPEKEFKAEAKFGRKVYVTAWAVEILAAVIGLGVAILWAWNGYQVSDKEQAALFQAITGALPYVVIAVIEPMKIPLATGLYRVTHSGWRILIFLALALLTLSTFETMSTGLEQQQFNVTRMVNEADREIDRLENEIASRDKRLEEIEALLDSNLLSKQSLLDELQTIDDQAGKTVQDQQIDAVDREIEKLLEQKNAIEKSLAAARNLGTGGSQDARSEKAAAEQQAITQKAEIETRLRNKLEELSAERETRRTNAKGWFGTPADKKAEIDSWYAEKRQEYERSAEQEKGRIDDSLQERKSEIDARLASDQKANSGEIQGLEASRTNIVSLINDARKQKATLIAAQSGDIQRTKASKVEQITEIEESTASMLKEKDLLSAEKKSFESELNDAKSRKRIEADKNQIYRLAFKISPLVDSLRGKEREPLTDIAEIDAETVSIVQSFWFGTIALVIATMGTILALIAVIMQDPEAFVVRRKLSLYTRMRKLAYVISVRLIRVLTALANVLLSLSKALLSFGQIFRGLIGKPLQRSFRRMVIDMRKRARQPKIVEKEVEREVIKEVIVEKEVPVEKVVLKEVPVEIVRKELVYVPLYSTESGLLDATGKFQFGEVLDGLRSNKEPDHDK